MNYVLDNWSFDPFAIVVASWSFCTRWVWPICGVGRCRRGPPASPALLLFYAGLGMLLLAIMSPIDYWAGRYFFVHMIEHILIGFFAPILIVLGAPWLPLLHGLPVGVRRRAGRALLLGRMVGPLRASVDSW